MLLSSTTPPKRGSDLPFELSVLCALPWPEAVILLGLEGGKRLGVRPPFSISSLSQPLIVGDETSIGGGLALVCVVVPVVGREVSIARA